MTALSRVEEHGCGCDAPEHQRGLVAIDEAVSRIMRSVRPVPETEEVALAAAHGRILAEPVCALSPAPPFDNAAMDGYAINTCDLTGTGPWHLAVTDRIAAGQTGLGKLCSGTAAQIFTGAPIPAGADAVVMQEDVQRSEGAIIISRKVEPRLHVRAVGKDMEAGAAVVPAGRQLTARDIAACAAAGAASISVRRRIRVALLVTGDEVEMPGQARKCAGIWDVNTPMLSAAIRMSAIDLVHVETGRDDRETLRQHLGDLAGRVDLIVTTGGISVGEEDHVRPALSDLGGRVVFSGVAIKPGKPVSFGHLGSAHWLGLPGNPLSAFITWQVFGPVLCQALAGGKTTPSPRRHVVLSRQLNHKHGRCELRLADLSGFDDMGREIAVFDDVTHSGRVARLATADGVIVIPADAETTPKSALVEFQPFSDR